LGAPFHETDYRIMIFAQLYTLGRRRLSTLVGSFRHRSGQEAKNSVVLSLPTKLMMR
jgi:hypothetical protein